MFWFILFVYYFYYYDESYNKIIWKISSSASAFQIWMLYLHKKYSNNQHNTAVCYCWSLPHPALSVIYLFWQSDKTLFFFLHYSHLHSFVLFNWFALYLPCALCHFISFFIFLLFYNVLIYMYIWLNCIYLYLNVYCQCLMLTVCT